MSEDVTFDLGAAAWRHAHGDEESYLEALAERLTRSLPSLVAVHRESHLFSKIHPLSRIEVQLDPDTYLLVKEHARWVPRKAKMVRGIILSTHELSLTEWLGELSQAITTYAQAHREARQSLEDFLL
ncbi:hypothetical protein [Ferroacidibacillus organovorans]|uniref:DUF5655 domain-containing protein n=1 Tax=Ferroacidibacillus organovorans TaxID=1765683 RepID=A0A1V4EQX1_9BACL|nr:hypothetical protein [Ferroacidibacillus organovorans]OPG15327.1 hypothetical protein B2M26_12775 [Ferroacidibacillus organovorans]